MPFLTSDLFHDLSRLMIGCILPFLISTQSILLAIKSIALLSSHQLILKLIKNVFSRGTSQNKMFCFSAQNVMYFWKSYCIVHVDLAGIVNKWRSVYFKLLVLLINLVLFYNAKIIESSSFYYTFNSGK